MSKGNSASAKSAGGTVKTYALFHGSPRTDIQDFDIEKAGTNTSTGEKFLFFTDSRDAADEFSYERQSTGSMFIDRKGAKGKVYEVDVTMKRPLDFSNPSNQDIKNLVKLSGGELTPERIKKFSKGNNQLLKAYVDLDKLSQFGYDGFIAKMDKQGHKEYAVLSGKQAKIRR